MGSDYPTPDGSAVRDYVHVADLANTVEAIAARGKNGATLVLGSQDAITVREVVWKIAATIGNRGTPIIREIAPTKPHFTLDVTAALASGVWNPMPIKELLTRFAKEIQEQVMERLLPLTFHDAIADKGLEIVGEPHLQHMDPFIEGAPLKYKAEFEVKPRFDLGEYRGLAYRNDAELQAWLARRPKEASAHTSDPKLLEFVKSLARAAAREDHRRAAEAALPRPGPDEQ